MSLRDSADRRRTVIDMLVWDAYREPETERTAPLEREPANGRYRGRAKVRVLPPGVGNDSLGPFMFGVSTIKSRLRGGARRHKR